MANKKKKVKIRYKRIFKCLLVLFIIIFSFVCLIKSKIRNIYVSGNNYYTDQQIIDLAGLKEYPTIMSIKTSKIKNKLKEDTFINDVEVNRINYLTGISIKIVENKPLLYYSYEEATILSDNSTTRHKFNVPNLINQTPDTILSKLIRKMNKIDDDVLIRISEIRYMPSEVDDELFYLTMNDGNFVYINIKNISKLNNYIDIIKSFDNKKGILHLDSGDYLEIK